MDITWYGGSCFCLRSGGLTVLTDPFDLPASAVLPPVDIVTLSQRSQRDALQAAGSYRLVDGPGEYEIKGITITGIAAREPRRVSPREADSLQPAGSASAVAAETPVSPEVTMPAAPASMPAELAGNVPAEPSGERTFIYSITLEHVVVCHLGRLRRAPSAQDLQQVGTPDVLLFPLGESTGLGPQQAAALATQAEVKLLVPARLGGEADRAAVERLCKELGADAASFEPRLTVTSSGLPAQTRVGLLAPVAGGANA